MSVSGMAEECLLGEAVPNTTGSIGFTSNTNTLPIVNTPPATGGITVAQSPAGTSVTNTGRTVSATQAYMAASLNALKE